MHTRKAGHHIFLLICIFVWSKEIGAESLVSSKGPDFSWELLNRRLEPEKREKADEWVEIQISNEKDLFSGIPVYAVPVLEKAYQYYRIQSEYKKAERLLLEIIEVQEQDFGPDSLLTVDVKYQAGWFYQNMAQYSKALEYLDKARQVTLLWEGADSERMGNIQNAMGVVNGNLGRHLTAEKCYLQALEIRQVIGGDESKDVATTLNNMATLYWSTENYSEAEKFYYRAYAIRQKVLGDKNYSTVTTLNNIALLHRSMGDYSRARSQFEKVLEMRREIHGEEHAFTLKTMHLLGLLYSDFGEYEKAENLLKQVASKRKALTGSHHPDTARSFFHLACFYDRLGRYEEARELHMEALEVRQLMLGDFHPETAGSYNFLAKHYHLTGELESAESNYLKALDIQRTIFGAVHSDSLKTINNLARLYSEIGNLDQAMQLMREAIRYREKMLMELFTFASEQQRINFQKTLALFDLAGSLGEPEDIARVAFRTKGVVLDSLVEDQLLAKASSDVDVEQSVLELRELSKALAQARFENNSGEVRKLEQETRSVRGKLSEKIVGMDAVRESISQAIQTDPAQVIQHIPAGSALVEYIFYQQYSKNFHSEASYGALVIKGGGEPVWIKLGSAKRINESVDQYQRYMRKRVSDRATQAALDELAAHIWHPIQKELSDDVRQIFISPDGAINFVSFAVLIDDTGRFLGETKHFEYLSSGRDLIQKGAFDSRSTSKTNTSSLVVFSDPDYGVSEKRSRWKSWWDKARFWSKQDRQYDWIQLSKLEGAAREEDFLRQHAADWNLELKIFSKTDASEENITQVKDPYILHIATHGIFLPEPDMKSTPEGRERMIRLMHPMHRGLLMLSGAQETLDKWKEGEVPPVENDGVLTAQEIGALSLSNTWLVVLSACDTGGGEVQAGEGVLGLRRGVRMAGAEHLLITLWPVADTETAVLMEKFYQAAMADGDAVQALFKAQSKYLQEWRRDSGVGQAARLAGPFILSR
ncbi:MAG: CHAT domain-containing tetratricopeptide repeat protein [Verrucomicrobiota bacterium]